MEEGIRFAEGLTPVAVEVDLFDQAAALRLTRHAARRSAATARGRPGAGRRGGAAGAHDPGRRRDPAQHRAWRARTRRMSRSTAAISSALDEEGNPADAGARRQARRGARADEPLAGWPRGQLLRRSAPELRRQCRQGDGRRQAGLSGGQPHARQARAGRTGAGSAARRGSTTSCARACTRSTG